MSKLNVTQLKVMGMVPKTAKEVFEEACALTACTVANDAKAWDNFTRKEREMFRHILRVFTKSIAENISPQQWHCAQLRGISESGWTAGVIESALNSLAREDEFQVEWFSFDNEDEGGEPPQARPDD